MIYIYKTHEKETRLYAAIKILKDNNQFFNHYIGLYDKGTHINDTGDPTIIFNYRNLYKYNYRGEEGEEIMDRSFAELYFTTEFFSDILELAKLIGPFEEE
ncbi:MAG: hypothetical protein U9N35_03785 [Euryarchaeota archaeon]|nr:hypothetical protein [Euryarchaeota archaeon]